MNQGELRINHIAQNEWKVVVMLPGLHSIVECETWTEAWEVATHLVDPLYRDVRGIPGTFSGEPAAVLKSLDAHIGDIHIHDQGALK